MNELLLLFGSLGAITLSVIGTLYFNWTTHKKEVEEVKE